ncbi:Protein of unknown function [Bifidobacterium bohemicum]|uniref:Hydrogenase n=1 Tax=Bifidobacterium bohemicum DSM 22767 TaxID=1437606 RepID=A0A086ZJ73_9BIFI|nr:DUF3737 family protein [Bifidobacterium bohemicum]KFI46573.1 hypothetical protein BBOH_0042 [Bifidobacterium bohemicum DSM 22767]SCB75561.1 Protein of unknown function [Bifidobacterium bohemicum]
MTTYKNSYFEGERPLFGQHDADVENVTFGKGESPLKEGRNLNVRGSIFTWKYPLWYCKNVEVSDTVFETMSRSGIWYTDKIHMKDCDLQAPKLFRRCKGVSLERVHFADAEETMWTCKDISMNHVQAVGNYFGKDSSGIRLDDVHIVGNYCFDGASDIEAHHCVFVSKDAFWNCENVTIYDSVLDGEYLAWNTKNLTLVNCTIESDQGLCYTDHLKMSGCRLLRTDLAFEYCSDVNAKIDGDIMSVKNPLSGSIQARHIGEVIVDATKVDPKRSVISSAIEPDRLISSSDTNNTGTAA